MRKETVMNITEREIDDPEKEGVILEYVNFTKEFAEIKEDVRSKGESIRGYTEKKECVSIRTEDILYFEAVQNKVFAYTSNKFYEIKSRLYQLEEKITRKCMKRASKTTIVNADRIVSVHTALNGRLYVLMEVLIIGVYVTVNLIVYVNDHMVAESMNQKLEEMRKRKDA